MRIAWWLAVVVGSLLPGSLLAQPSHGCNLGFIGSARPDVKNRKPSDGAKSDPVYDAGLHAVIVAATS